MDHRHPGDAMNDDSDESVSPLTSASLATLEALTRYAVQAIGTNRGQDCEETIAWVAIDWLVRVHTPVWLRLAGMGRQAAELGALPEVTAATAERTVALLEAMKGEAKATAYAVMDAALTVARDADDPVMVDVQELAWDAAADTCWFATSSGAAMVALGSTDNGWDDTRGAVRAAAWMVARNAALAVAANPAWRAAWAETGNGTGFDASVTSEDVWSEDVWEAAAGAAWDALRPGVHNAQHTAFQLLDRMIEVAKGVS